MAEQVLIDAKGRISLPYKFRKKLHLKARQAVAIEVSGDKLIVEKQHKLTPENDKLLYDIMVKPGHSKVRLTKALLEKMKDELWSGR